MASGSRYFPDAGPVCAEYDCLGEKFRVGSGNFRIWNTYNDRYAPAFYRRHDWPHSDDDSVRYSEILERSSEGGGVSDVHASGEDVGADYLEGADCHDYRVYQRSCRYPFLYDSDGCVYG